jgi:hypothetical protein
VIAIGMMMLRFHGEKERPRTEHVPGAPNVGGLLIGLIALAMVVAAYFPMLRFEVGRDGGGDSVLIMIASALSAGGVLFGLAALITGYTRAQADESNDRLPSVSTRLGGIVGTVAAGGGLGLGMSLLAKTVEIPAHKVVYDGELSAVAYIILAIATLLVVGGLFWCFYRAIKAAGERDAEEQVSEA